MPSYHEVTVTESKSLSTEQLFEKENSLKIPFFTGEVVGNALENKKIVLKEQRKENSLISLKKNHCTYVN